MKNDCQTWCVYLHKNKINNKVYIGQTKSALNLRWKNGNGYKNSAFEKDIQKFGWDNFEHIVLFKNIKTQDEANKIEMDMIKKYDSTNPEKGYNRQIGGVHQGRLKGSKNKKRKNIKLIEEKGMMLEGFTISDNLIRNTISSVAGGKAALLYITLFAHFDQKTQMSTVPATILSKETNFSLRKIIELIDKLESFGFIGVIRHQGRKPNSYFFPLESHNYKT